MVNKPILVLDFDGVVHSYTSGWQGAAIIPDPPVPGAIQFILSALHVFDVCIFSSRSEIYSGREAMRHWLYGHSGAFWYPSPEGPGLEEVRFPEHKPAAFLSIDDRALLFDGTWPDPAKLLGFKPWNKRPECIRLSGRVAITDGPCPRCDDGPCVARTSRETAEEIAAKYVHQQSTLADQIQYAIDEARRGN